MKNPPNILTVAGSDSGGGAGIQADLKTIMALGGYGMSAITALTAQNGLGVLGIHAPEPDFLALQLQAIQQGFPIDAAKTGMLFSAGIIAVVADFMEQRTYPLVVDPVSVSQSGSQLLQTEAIEALRNRLIPLCDIVTPNTPEAAMLTGIPITTQDDIFQAGERLLQMGAKNVLIKGGHMDNAILVTDYLFSPDSEPLQLSHPKITTSNNHGTGCTLSAAIASCLGKKLPMSVAVKKAQEYLLQALSHSYAPGNGCGPVNHAFLLG